MVKGNVIKSVLLRQLDREGVRGGKLTRPTRPYSVGSLICHLPADETRASVRNVMCVCVTQ